MNYLKKIAAFFLVLFFHLTGYSQEFSSVLIMGDDEPNLPFSELIFDDIYGIISDNNGKVSLKNEKIQEYDSVQVMHLGYETATIPIKTLLTTDTIILYHKVFSIVPIVINPDNNKPIIIGNKKNKTASIVGSFGFETGMVIPYHSVGIKQLTNIKVYVREGIGEYFRIKIYSVDSSYTEFSTFVDKDIIIKINNENKWYDFDVSDYNIMVYDKNQFFVSIQILPSTVKNKKIIFGGKSVSKSPPSFIVFTKLSVEDIWHNALLDYNQYKFAFEPAILFQLQ